MTYTYEVLGVGATEEQPCSSDPDMWFAHSKAKRAQAAQLCLDCPVMRECLSVALKNGEQYGVWGGFDLQGRRT